MIDLNKSLEWFDPATVTKTVHIIGCGAVGSQVAVLLARLGIKKFSLWDEDTVATHNIANQNFTFNDVGRPKTECVAETIQAINPDAQVNCHGFWDETQGISGEIILCVDSIAVRQRICDKLLVTPGSYRVYDFRMGLTSGQFYAVTNPQDLMVYRDTMNFTDAEADATTPHSACGFELSVAYSIWTMLGIGVSLMVRTWKGESVPMTTIIDTGNLCVLPV